MNARNSTAGQRDACGCAIGEIQGLLIGTALGLSTDVTIVCPVPTAPATQ